jgi:hypothetical protein
MKNNFKKTILVVALATIAFNVSAQEAAGSGTSLQTATAFGDRTYVAGSGSLVIDHMSVHAPGSSTSGFLTAHDSGYAFGQGASTFDGGVTGNIAIKAIPGHASGQGGSEQFAISQTTEGGVAHSNVGGKTKLFGWVQLPVDPIVRGMAFDRASSGNIVGIPAASSGFNWVTVDLSATMHH